jgi:hypothetical protein
MTHELITTVYLNDPPQFLGFNRGGAAKLFAAAGFTTTLEGEASATEIKVVLEKVFDQLNIDDPDKPWAIAYREASNRSLSVGDVVVIGETAWAVGPRGWDLITADQLHDAIYHH